MNPSILIDQVITEGGRIVATGGKLKLSAPKPLSSELVENLKAHKADVMALLQKEHGAPISELKSSNDHTKKRFAYQVELSDGCGMVWLCNFAERGGAINRLEEQFKGRKVTKLELIKF